MNIGWRQLLIVAVVAVVFGGGAGYLGGNFEWGSGTRNTLTAPSASRPLIALGGGSLEERVGELEQEIGGGFSLYGGSIQSRLSQLEQQVGRESPFSSGTFGTLESVVDSLDRKVSQLEQQVGREDPFTGYGSLERDVSELKRRVGSLESQSGGGLNPYRR